LAKERGNGKETEGNLIRRVIALIGLFKQQGKGKGDGRNRGCSGGPAKQRRRRKKGERKETNRWDPVVSESKEKEKERDGVDRCGEGLLGRLGRKVRRSLSLFFSIFVFKLFLKQTFLFKFKPNPFKLFLKNFINFLEATQATKNHAKQTDDAQSLVVSILIKLCLIF
jgi:hypothetical protein